MRSVIKKKSLYKRRVLTTLMTESKQQIVAFERVMAAAMASWVVGDCVVEGIEDDEYGRCAASRRAWRGRVRGVKVGVR